MIKQEEFDAYLKNVRDNTFESSTQLTLGELIEKLEARGVNQKENGEYESKWISFDFGSAIPTSLDSWRGSYSELALGYALSGREGEGDYENTTVESLLKELKNSVGKTFYGWKGGDFIMDKDTPIWVANSGSSDSTGVIGVLDIGWKVILLTAYCEY